MKKYYLTFLLLLAGVGTRAGAPHQSDEMSRRSQIVIIHNHMIQSLDMTDTVAHKYLEKYMSYVQIMILPGDMPTWRIYQERRNASRMMRVRIDSNRHNQRVIRRYSRRLIRAWTNQSGQSYAEVITQKRVAFTK
ncbi:MAG: hypothetical protein FWC83_00345 [Alphaproteobacteria bacterium]|nr:hypothetical protein [Alphaproteobacteria bacterium]